MSPLFSVGRSYRNKLTLYLSQIKPYFDIISEVSRKPKNRLSVQVVRLFDKVCFLHLYTIKLLSSSSISANFEAAELDFMKLLESIKDDR